MSDLTSTSTSVLAVPIARNPNIAKHWPMWFAVGVLLLLVSMHTQVTLRHAAYWLAGVQYGMVGEVRPGERTMEMVVVDPMAEFKPNALVGSRLWVVHDLKGGQATGSVGGESLSWPVLGNTTTEITIGGAADDVPAKLPSHTHYLTGFASPSGLAGLALKVPGINLTVADGLLVIGLVVLAILVLRREKLPSWRILPWPVLVLLAFGLVSLVDPLRVFSHTYKAANPGMGFKEWLQYGEVLLAGYLFFRLSFEDGRLRRWGVYTLLAMATLMIGVALLEYAMVMRGTTLRGLLDIHEIDSLWGFRYNPGRTGDGGSESNRNILATYLMVMLPIVLSFVGCAAMRHWRWGLALVAACGVAATLNLAHLLAVLAGCLTVALCWHLRRAVPLVLGGAVVVLLVSCLVVREHGRILLDSVAVSKTGDPYGSLPMPLKGGTNKTVANWQPVQQKYLEMQAALNALGNSPVIGMGIGHYQTRINGYYSDPVPPTNYLSKEPRNYMEPNAHGLYFIALVETGLLGLATWLWFLGSNLANALQLRRAIDRVVDRASTAGVRTDAELQLTRAMGIGVAGALVALLVGGFFASFMVRGLGLLVVALMAWVAAANAAYPVSPRD